MAGGLADTPPASATLDPHISRKSPEGPNGGPRSFDDLLKNDRSAVRITLNTLMNSDKWKMMKGEDRKAAMKKTISDKLMQRKTRRGGQSAIRQYPDRVDVKKEIERFLRLDAWRIVGASAQDDPEPDSVLAGGRRIKKEKNCDDDESDTEQSETSADEEVNDEADGEDNDEDKQEKLTSCIVVSRGLVIQNGDERVGRFTTKTTARPQAKADSNSAKGKIGVRGILKEQKWKHTKRSWKWVDGKMMVWPVIDALV